MSGRVGRVVSWRALAIAAVIALIVIAWRAGLFALHDVTRLRAAVDAARATPALPVVFVVAYIVLSAIGVPASALTLAGGALFGTTRGVALNWIGAFGGAMVAFVIVRTISPDAVTRILRGNRSAARLLGDDAPMLLFRLRLVPVAPFALLNAGAAM